MPNVVACGGTFDHFHKGHETFLRYAFSSGDKIIIGVTSDKYVRRLKIEDRGWRQIEPFETRRQSAVGFVKEEKVLNKVEIIRIDDLFGPTLSKDLLIDGIVVSQNSKKGAEIINQKRKELGLIPLKIVVAPSIKCEDGKLITSARIRNGEINGAGKLYINSVWFKKDLVLPENLRQELKKPFGILGFDVSKHQNKLAQGLVVAVGDATAKKFNDCAVEQKLSVVDFKIARQEKFSSFAQLGFAGNEEIITVNNPAGHITSELFGAITKIFKSGFAKRVILKVTGEEDLAVLPLVLAAPLGALIYYGQPGQGLVEILVSERIKDRAYSLLTLFKPI